MTWHAPPPEQPFLRTLREPSHNDTAYRQRYGTFRQPLWLSPESEWLGFFTSDMLQSAEHVLGRTASFGTPSVLIVSPRPGKETPLREIDIIIWNERASSRFRKLGREVPNTPDHLRVFLQEHQLIGSIGIPPHQFSLPLSFPEESLLLPGEFVAQLRSFRAFRWHVPLLFELVDLIGDGASIHVSDEQLRRFLSLPESVDIRTVLEQTSVQKFFATKESDNGITIAPHPFETLFDSEDEKILDVLSETAGEHSALFKVDKDYLDAQGIDIEQLFELASKGLLLIEGIERWDNKASSFFVEIA